MWGMKAVGPIVVAAVLICACGSEKPSPVTNTVTVTRTSVSTVAGPPTVPLSTPSQTSPAAIPPPTVGPAPSRTTPTSAPTAPARQPRRFAGTGAFAIGSEPAGGLPVAIPPGRYRVEIDNWEGNESGRWIRCSDYLCGPSSSSSVINTGYASGRSYTEIIELAPSDAAIYIEGIRLVEVQ